ARGARCRAARGPRDPPRERRGRPALPRALRGQGRRAVCRADRAALRVRSRKPPGRGAGTPLRAGQAARERRLRDGPHRDGSGRDRRLPAGDVAGSACAAPHAEPARASSAATARGQPGSAAREPPPALARLILRRTAEDAAGDDGVALPRRDIDRILGASSQGSSVVELSGGLCAVVEYGWVRFDTARPEGAPEPVPLTIPGSV